MTGDPKKLPEECEEADEAVSATVEEVGQQNGTSLVLAQSENPPTVVDDQVTELQEQLAEAKDEKSELIFYFCLTVVIVFDVFAFPYIGNTIGIVIISFFECLLLLGFANRLGVEGPAVFLASIMRAIESQLKKGGGE